MEHIMVAKSTWPVAGIAASLLAITGAPLLAQDYSGAFTFGYTSNSLGGTSGGSSISGLPDVSAVTLHGTMQVQFPDGFRFGARLVHVSPDIEGLGDLDLAITGNELTAGYAMSNGVWFGVYSEQIDVTGSFGGITLPVTIGQHYYGVEGGTNVAGVAVRGFVGNGNDTTSYGISGRYAGDRYTVGGYYTHSDVGLLGIEADLDSYGIGGVYNVNQQFVVFGGVANSSVSYSGTDLVDIMSYGIGVSYDLSSMVNLPLFASLEYGGTKLTPDSALAPDTHFDMDGFTLSVTVPMGQSRSMVPENSVAAAVLNPTHSGLSQAVLMAF